MRETMRFLITAIIFTFALFGFAFLLTGCTTTKYVECVMRDNTSNPCN